MALLLCLLACAPAWAEPPREACSTGKWGHVHCIRMAHYVYDTCNAIDIFARRHGLNREFFARLIWQESRFDPNALSPANARGIAQFIPSTAQLRGLKDPYNPADALEHSAQYLAEMVARYGNEGLAAIGYNGGERRAEGFLQGGGLARETINYVPIITGLTAEDWRDNPPKDHDMRLSRDKPFLPGCYEMAQNRRLTPLARPEGRFSPWGVQLAFGRTKNQARAAFDRQTARCRGAVRREKPEFVPVKHRIRGKQGYVMARIGRRSREDADRLCNRIRRAGCVCAVYANK
ncbi:MAG: lytic transglycosylase domain-containing protein [Pseudomonadota bacterium]